MDTTAEQTTANASDHTSDAAAAAARAAIQQELDEKLRGHREHIKSFDKPSDEPSPVDANGQASEEVAGHSNGLSASSDVAIDVDMASAENQPPAAPPQHEQQQPQQQHHYQPVNLDNQLATEQHLEADVRLEPQPHPHPQQQRVHRPARIVSDRRAHRSSTATVPLEVIRGFISRPAAAAAAVGADVDARDRESATTSLSESIYNYRREHGRTYHAYKDGKYFIPNDDREADRLDLQYHLLRITYGNKIFFSPVQNLRRCLDVGTGTGIWALDFADDHPECQVIGIDLSPGQPTLVPPNLKFVIDDAEDQWIYDDKFDFIHASLMAGCFSDWPNFFRQAFENLEPGGYLELQDYGLPVKSADGTHLGTDILKWGELLCEGARALGRPMGSDVSERYVDWMHAAGFVDVEQRMFMWPSNSWPKDRFMKELGRWNQVNIIDGLEGFCLALLTRGLGWTKAEVDIFVAKVTADFRDKKIHAYFPMPVTFGRKPFPGEMR